MESSEENAAIKYRYYCFRDSYIAREVVGNHECAMNRFDFYLNGKWINDYRLSLSLSDATMCVMGYSMFDYRELTEEEAMRRIAEEDKKQ